MIFYDLSEGFLKLENVREKSGNFELDDNPGQKLMQIQYNFNGSNSNCWFTLSDLNSFLVSMVPSMRFLWSNFCIYVFVLCFHFLFLVTMVT